MQEEIVQFETAKLLKRCGFPQVWEKDPFSCFTFSCYDLEGNEHLGASPYDEEANYAAPTQALAMRWLREEKKVFAWVEPCGTEQYEAHAEYVIYKNGVEDSTCYITGRISYDTYEQAAEQAIAAACRHLLTQTKGE